VNKDVDFAVHLARELLEDLGGDPNTMPKYNVEQTLEMNRLLKRRCDQADVDINVVMGIAARAIMNHSPVKAERLRRMSLQHGHVEAQSARMAAIADRMH
jgi:hypothetical protein